MREPAVTEYQVHQTSDGAEILLRHETPVDSDALATSVVVALGKVGLAHARVTVHSVDSIPRLGSGKVKRFVPKR